MHTSSSHNIQLLLLRLPTNGAGGSERLSVQSIHEERNNFVRLSSELPRRTQHNPNGPFTRP